MMIMTMFIIHDVHYTRCSLYTISEVDNDYLDGEEYDMDNKSNTRNTNK